MLRRAKYLIPIGVGVAVLNPLIVFAKDENANTPPKRQRTPWDVYCEPPVAKGKEGCKAKEGGATGDIEKCISKCRQNLEPAKDEVGVYLAQAQAYAKSATSIIQDQVKFLQTSASDEVRYATIAGGTVLGFLLGIRRNFFKKLLYAAVTGTGTAAIIYPKEAKIIAREGFLYTRATAKDLYSQVKGDNDATVKSTANSSKAKCSTKKAEPPTPKDKCSVSSMSLESDTSGSIGRSRRRMR